MGKKMGKKGISPLIASVLLIAFTVAAFGVIQTWGTGFISSTTQDVSDKTDTELTCVYGGISVSNLRYCNDYMGGRVENTNMIDLGDIVLQIIYTNSSSQKFDLNVTGTTTPIVLEPGEIESFNISIGGSNYDRIHVYTNCSDVTDDAESSDVTAC